MHFALKEGPFTGGGPFLRQEVMALMGPPPPSRGLPNAERQSAQQTQVCVRSAVLKYMCCRHMQSPLTIYLRGCLERLAIITKAGRRCRSEAMSALGASTQVQYYFTYNCGVSLQVQHASQGGVEESSKRNSSSSSQQAEGKKLPKWMKLPGN